MIELTVPGYHHTTEDFDPYTKEEKDKYCEHCYDTTYFPAYACRDCPLYVRGDTIFCIECQLLDKEADSFLGFGKCTKTGSYPASGYGCSDGVMMLGGKQ